MLLRIAPIAKPGRLTNECRAAIALSPRKQHNNDHNRMSAAASCCSNTCTDAHDFSCSHARYDPLFTMSDNTQTADLIRPLRISVLMDEFF